MCKMPMQSRVMTAQQQGHLRVGLGMSRRPTPKMATAKKCITSTEGRGFRPDRRDTGPAEYQPPRRR